MIAVKFNERLERLGVFSFKDTRIKKLVLSANINCISDFAFYHCIHLRYADLRPAHNLKVLKTGAFSLSNLSRIELNDGLEIIGSECFNDCKFEEFSVPNGIQRINDNAF